MSKLTDFFPQSSGTTEKNATILLVGGGGGGGAGLVGYYPTCCDQENLQGWGHGGGGGGVFIAKTDIVEGCTYPVTVGAGGACGCLTPACAGEPGGAGSNGGYSSFGRYSVLGGGGAGTKTFFRCAPCPNDLCYTNCQWDPTIVPLAGPGKFVGNKVGANMGSMFTGCGCYTTPCGFVFFSTRSAFVASGANPDINSFRSGDNRCSAGGGFQATYYGCQTPPNAPQAYLSNQSVNYAVSDGHFIKYPADGGTAGGWEIVPSFFGLALIPCDTCNPACCDRIVYCCGPSCNYGFGSCPGPQSGSFSVLGNIPVLNFGLGNSRIGRRQGHQKCPNTNPCGAGTPAICPEKEQNGAYNYIKRGCFQPSIPHTGGGGMNNWCIGNEPEIVGYDCYCGGFGCTCNACNNYSFSANGDAGVVYVVYDCDLGAASSTPGAVDCTPVTGPQGYRSYRYTSSGSFTL